MVLLALALAAAYCAPPGPVTAEAFRQLARRGWRGALGVELGSVIGDAAYGALAISGLHALLEVGWTHRVLGAAGVALLLYLAWQGFRQARTAPLHPAPAADGPGRTFWSAFGAGAGLALANPMAIPFWLSFGGAAAVLHGPSAAPATLWTFFAAFVAGCLAWGLLVTLILARVRAWLSPALVRAVSLAAALVLAGCGVAMGAALLGA